MNTRVAGTGTAGGAGNGGPATDAQLNGPVGVAVTADGGFLIAGTFNKLPGRVVVPRGMVAHPREVRGPG